MAHGRKTTWRILTAELQPSKAMSETKTPRVDALEFQDGTLDYEAWPLARTLELELAEAKRLLAGVLDCISETRGKDATDAVEAARAFLAR